MYDVDKIDYMINSLNLAKQEILYAQKYKEEIKNNPDIIYVKKNPNGTIIRESLNMVGRLAYQVSNNIALSAHNNKLFKDEQ